MEKEGNVFVILGASGSGKTTLCEAIYNSICGIKKIVYYTTREKRVGEWDGEDYIFISLEDFEYLKSTGKIKYFYLCHENYYGIPDEIDMIIQNGKSVILGISRKLLPKIYEDYSKVNLIYVDVTKEESEKRMKNRDSNIKEKDFLNRTEKLDDMREWAKNNLSKIDLYIDNTLSIKEAEKKIKDYINERMTVNE